MHLYAILLATLCCVASNANAADAADRHIKRLQEMRLIEYSPRDSGWRCLRCKIIFNQQNTAQDSPVESLLAHMAHSHPQEPYAQVPVKRTRFEN